MRNSCTPGEPLPVAVSAQRQCAAEDVRVFRRTGRVRRPGLRRRPREMRTMGPRVQPDKWLAITDLTEQCYLVRDRSRVTDLADPSWLLSCIPGFGRCGKDRLVPG